MAEEKTKKNVAEVPEKEVKTEEIRRGYILPRNAISNRTHHPVIVNGKTFLVQAGVRVDLPEYVAKVLDDAIDSRNSVYEAIEKAKKRAE